GSRVVSINGQTFQSADSFTTFIQEHKGEPITISWQHLETNETGEDTIVPRINPPEGQGALGVGFYPMETAVLTYDTPIQKVFSGFIHPANLMVYQFDVLKKIIGVSVREGTAEPLGGAVAGPVGIYNVVGSFLSIPDAKERFLQLLNLTGLLSLSLAFFNVLPIPALDGG